jgi:hypothetical protein
MSVSPEGRRGEKFDPSKESLPPERFPPPGTGAPPGKVALDAGPPHIASSATPRVSRTFPRTKKNDTTAKNR